METPPQQQDEKVLGRTFYILLLTPVVVMANAVAVAATEKAGDIAMIFSWVAVAGMVLCSFSCAAMIGKSKGFGYALLGFLGILVFYTGIAFAGCSSVLSGIGI